MDIKQILNEFPSKRLFTVITNEIYSLIKRNDATGNDLHYT